MASIYVRSVAGAPVSARVYVGMHASGDTEDQISFKEAEMIGDGEFRIGDRLLPSIVGVFVDPQEPGYWQAWQTGFRPGDTIFCPTIQESGYSWWHDILGSHLSEQTRGLGVRIGVIDAGFNPDAVGLEAQIVHVGGGQVQSAAGRYVHGEAVCRILGDTTAPDCCAPIAPCAELFFASASFSRMTLRHRGFRLPITAAHDQEAHLDPTLIINAIFAMVFEKKVDLINLSAGAVNPPSTVQNGMAEVIRIAADAGTTVICAAGNSRGAPDFPACEPDTIGVGVFANGQWGPSGSAIRSRDFTVCDDEDHVGSWANHSVFPWDGSPSGPGVDTVAPGVGILIARDGEAAFDLTGSSFSTPIVTGALAVALAKDDAYLSMPRDRARMEHVKRRLRSNCLSTGMPHLFEGAGAMLLD